MIAPFPASDGLVRFCAELRQLRRDAGVAVKALAGAMQDELKGRTLGPIRANEIENCTRVIHVPDWDLVQAWVKTCTVVAVRDQRALSGSTDLMYWQVRHRRVTEDDEQA